MKTPPPLCLGVLSAPRLLWLCVLFSAGGCDPAPSSRPVRERPVVVTSFFPVYDFARRIGGDAIDVDCLVPPGGDPHSAEASPSAARRVVEADLVLLLGLGMDGWVEKLSRAERTIFIVSVSEGLPTRPDSVGSNPRATPHDGHAHGANHDAHAGIDPHVWLDPLLAKRIARRIGDALVRVAPAHHAALERRTAELEAELDALHQEFETGLAHLPRREVVTFHGAFAYLFARYNLRAAAVIEPFPGDEPSAADLRYLVEITRGLGIRTIMAEPQLPDRPAQIIAREIGGRVERLDPCETLLADSPTASYIDRQRRNLAVLKEALQLEAATRLGPKTDPSP
jgi:zinc transport system substrate-binding protein